MASIGLKILTITTGSALLAAPPSYGWEANGFAGQDTIYSSEVLPDPGALGWIGGGKVVWSPSKLPVSFGAMGTYSRYLIESGEEFTDGSTSKTGSMQGWQVGPTVVVRAPWQSFTPFFAASYGFGQYEYNLSSQTAFVNGQSQLETDLDMKLAYASQTITGSAGFRIGGAWGFTCEFLEMRHIFAVSSAKATVRNRVDGELQSNDGGEETAAELFQGLEGERFHHSTRSLVIGVSYRP